MRCSRRIGGVAGIAVFGLAAMGCTTTGPPSGSHVPAEEECLLWPGGGGDRGPVTIAVAEAVDPAAAPRPRSYSERLVFRHLYEGLVRVDCRGEIRPGLAVSWRPQSSGLGWRFTLRKGIRWWDGSPLTAFEVAAGWTTPEGTPRPGIPFESVTAVNDRTLLVSFAEPDPRRPSVLADPGLAVIEAAAGSPWKRGTGPYRVAATESSDDGGSAHSIVLNHAASGSGAGLPAVEFRLASGSDLRDLLDGRADLLVTDDPAVLEYAAGRPQYVSLPLPWHRSLVLLSPAAAAGAIPPAVAHDFRAALARDALRGEARGSEGPFWWEEGKACRVSVGPELRARRERTTKRIVYPRGDRDARDLAERLVALAAGPARTSDSSVGDDGVTRTLLGGKTGLQATALAPGEFAEALQAGDQSAYLVPLPRRVLRPCREIQSLIDRAGWLAAGAAGTGDVEAMDLGLEQLLIPLVDTRFRAVARRELPPLRVDWDGAFVIAFAESRR
jgi:hypothetical protein